MILNYKIYGEGYPLLIIHGLFGSLDNWLTFTKNASNNFKVILVDLINHGNSPKTNYFNIDLMVKDVNETLESLKINELNIMGHSLGGKVAMKYACLFPSKVNKLCVVDIAPKLYEIHHQEIINSLKKLPIKTISSRSILENLLSADIPDTATRNFLLKNLTRDEEGNFIWKINIPVIEKNLKEISKTLNKGEKFNGPTLFIKGEKSDYIVEEDKNIINYHFPLAYISIIKDAGHWVHSEQAELFYKDVISFF